MYAIVDIEATGGNSRTDKITEVAIYLYDGEQVVDTYVSLINPERTIPPFVSRLTGITDKMVSGAPVFEEAAQEIYDITEGAVFVAHNVEFDYSFIKRAFKDVGIKFQRKRLDTLHVSKILLPHLESHGLDSICRALGIENQNRHRAEGDTEATLELFKMLVEKDTEGYISTLIDECIDKGSLPSGIDQELIRQLPEEIGVYRFINSEEEVIFLGKTVDIKFRVCQHLIRMPGHLKDIEMFDEIENITHLETGNELISAIVEAYELDEYEAKYNKTINRRAYKYGIFEFKNAKGYRCLKIQKLEEAGKLVAKFATYAEANKAVLKRMKQYKLHPALCGRTKENMQVSIKISARDYNRRVAKALTIYLYPDNNCLIIGEGRNTGEISAVKIENQSYVGWGFFEEIETEDPKSIAEKIEKQRELAGINKVILAYLKKNTMDTIVQY